MTVSAWEAVFMLVVLKIPVIYLAAVVWWAVRAEPTGEVGGDEAGVLTPLPPCGWDDWKRRRARVRGWRPNRPPGRVALRARVS
ncbi:MAG TPA: hypothetical protein VFO64_04570 [Gaiellaceae bacterium]|nr:hypothetical protein [Gaiellaceae bacterium]